MLLCVCVTDNPSQISSVLVAVRILDVNDNPPALTHYLEAYLCENAKAGQVEGRPPPPALPLLCFQSLALLPALSSSLWSTCSSSRR